MSNDIDDMVNSIDAQIAALTASFPKVSGGEGQELWYQLKLVTRQYNELLVKYGVRS